MRRCDKVDYTEQRQVGLIQLRIYVGINNEYTENNIIFRKISYSKLNMDRYFGSSGVFWQPPGLHLRIGDQSIILDTKVFDENFLCSDIFWSDYSSRSTLCIVGLIQDIKYIFNRHGVVFGKIIDDTFEYLNDEDKHRLQDENKTQYVNTPLSVDDVQTFKLIDEYLRMYLRTP